MQYALQKICVTSVLHQIRTVGHFRHIPPQETFVKLANEIFTRGNGGPSPKLAQNLSEMDVRTFARIKRVIWDQLLAVKAEIIQS